MKQTVAYNYDSYNQTMTEELCQSLKAVQGGDDVPRVLIVYETDNTNREKIFVFINNTSMRSEF